MKRNKINLMGLAVFALCGAITLGTLGIPSAFAADPKTDDETVTVTIGDNIVLIVTPPSAAATTCGGAAACDPNNIVADPENGTVATGWSDTYTSTNNASGAKLQISMVCDDSDTLTAGCQDQNTNTLVGVTDNTYSIAAGTVTAANQWGYRFYDITSTINGLGHNYDIDTDDMTAADTAGAYAAVPLFAAPTTLWTSSAAGNKTIRNVYGVKVDNTLKAQDYTNVVLFTLSNNI